jgi:hypothetical protein
LKVRSQNDASTLDIRIAVPDDAQALASTTRLGFESYRAWAHPGWRPPDHRLELRGIRERLRRDPGNYISQPMVRLSVCPTLMEDGIRPRHVDLRPFAVTGRSTWVLPGGLSRVALRQGSLIVNSSQGGGSKDTWVLV